MDALVPPFADLVGMAVGYDEGTPFGAAYQALGEPVNLANRKS